MKRALAVAAVLGAAVVVSRAPLATQLLWQWDSVLYARALEDGFHVDHVLRDSRPHPPGYVFYVALAGLFRAALRDSNASLVAVSILASAIAAILVFVFARRFAGDGRATVAAAGFAFSPLVWFYGEVAYPYTTLAALAIALAMLFWIARERSDRSRVLASLLFGVAAGFRQDALLLFGPLWLWTIWRGSARARLASGAAVVLGSLAWAVPTVALSGGPAEYLESLGRQTAGVAASYSVALNGLAALGYNAAFTLDALVWGLAGCGALLVALAAAHAAVRLRDRRTRIVLGERHAFFALWIVPPLGFYLAVHIGEWGYVLSVLPACYVLAALLLPRGRSSLRLAATALVVSGAVLFLYAPGSHFSYLAQREHDRVVAAKVAFIRANFDGRATVVLAREDYLHVRYYLTEYTAWYHDPDPYAPRLRVNRRMPRTASAVVLFSATLQPMRQQEVKALAVGDGVTLRYLPVDPDGVVEFSGTRFGVREPR